jgi:putative oxidoreductase
MFGYIFQTEGGLSMSLLALALRLILAIVIFPHGAQKLLGLFGGYGYKGTMAYFTHTVGVPYLFGLLAIIAEFFGPLALAAGLLTRFAALGIGATMVVAALTVHRPHGFFMNWFGNQDGEGYEYFILAAGIALVLAIVGGGAWSLDYLLATRLF